MDISRGRIVQDKDNVGGLRAAYFINYDEASPTGGLSVTFDNTNTDQVAMLGTAVSLFKYDLRGTSSFTQTLNPSRENGTIFSEQILTLSLKKFSIETHQDMFALAAQRPQIIVEDYNGTLHLGGLEYGMDMDPSTLNTGAAMGDLSGYEWVFKGMEKKNANLVLESAIWTTGNTGSLTADQIFTGITINGTAGTAARS